MRRPSAPQFSRPHTSVALPGAHGFVLFLAPDAECPVPDVTDTSEQLDVLVRELAAALASRCALNANTE